MIVDGFRSFGNRQELDLDNLTSLVGGNGVGKTSFLLALSRMFGSTQKERGIINGDFFVSPGTSIDDQPERTLNIEVKITFPELVDENSDLDSVADCFRNMVVDSGVGENQVPYCRIRLESTYTRDPFGDGEIRTKLLWIRSSYQDEGDEVTTVLSSADRQRIRVLYVPASRDPHHQLQEFSGSLIGRFVKSISWQTNPEETLKTAVEEAKVTLDAESGVKVINETVEKNWTSLSPSFRSAIPRLNFIDDNVKKMMKSVSMNFENGGEQLPSELTELSDGEKSLFYFSLLQSALGMKDMFVNNGEFISGDNRTRFSNIFDEEKLQLPNLTLLAIEEPENHLSPHHFGQLIESFKEISGNSSSQVIFSSHSPSIISRIDPENIRYFRIDNGNTVNKKLVLPESDTQAFTYVKEAVKAYPELYFSKVVVLGEGDSEEIILRKLFEARGLPLDRSMISIVPLGGRFVNHFWRLLNGLDIPFVTLLDLDLGKEGAGWGRIKYVISQLIENGKTWEDVCGEGDGALTRALHETLHTVQVQSAGDYRILKTWLGKFETDYNLYFSSKLDIDMMMLDRFFENYTSTILPPERGPLEIPLEEGEAKTQFLLNLKKQLFGSLAESVNYYENEKLRYYRYFFLSKGKPLTHNLVLKVMEDETFLNNCPRVLLRLADSVEAILRPEEDTPEEPGDTP